MSETTDLYYYTHSVVNVKLLIEYGENVDDFSFKLDDTEESYKHLCNAKYQDTRSNLKLLLLGLLRYRCAKDDSWEMKKHGFYRRNPKINCRLMVLLGRFWHTFSVAMSPIHVDSIQNATSLTEKLNIVFAKGEFEDERYQFPEIFGLQQAMRHDGAFIAAKPVVAKPRIKRSRMDDSFVEVDGRKT